MPGYTIEKLLGRGGMGAVYKGVQSNLDRPVAIKILPPGVDQEDPSFAERFKNEARLMARLNNPAVVSVHDFGLTTDGLLYFAMEYVDGTDVSQMIRSQGKLPPDHALAITAHVCDALSAAHELGIVHRDIKPANVLINMKGQVKVADFGLAKIEDPGQHGLTKTGYAMGTPDFVAPEVLMLGSHIDGRADLYAVGVMLYQMLTGEVPRGAFKPATARLPGLDPRFDPIILKAMQSDREERYQSSTELRRDLDVILTVPFVRQDEPPTSAIPAAQVAQTPAQRSAVQKRSDAPVQPKKSSAPLLVGLGAAAAIGIGAFVMLGGSGSRQAAEEDAKGSASPQTTAQNTPPTTTKPPTSGSASPSNKLTSPAAASTSAVPAASGTSAAPQIPTAKSPQPARLPDPAKWVKAFETPKSLESFKGQAAWTQSGIHLTGTIAPTNSTLQDAAVRLKVKKGTNIGLMLRAKKDNQWSANVKTSQGTANFQVTQDGAKLALEQFDVPPSVTAVEEIDLEFVGVGNILSLSINGVQAHSMAVPAKASTGMIHIFSADGHVRDIAWQSLDGPASAPEKTAAIAASPSPPLPVPSSLPPATTTMAAAPASELDQRLAALDSGFQAAVERDANAAFKASIAALDKLYLTALDRALATASKGGKLEEALALREEKQRIEKGQGVPSEVDESTQAPGKVPGTLKTLRKTYRSTTAQHEATKAKAMQPLYDKYDLALAAVQTELTQAQKLDDALRVKSAREQIAAARSGQTHTAATSSAPNASSPVATAASSSAGDWLSVARKRGGPLKLWGGADPGQNIPVPAKAAKYDDYVSLNMMNLMKRVLLATRRDGNVVALDFTDFPKIEVAELRDTMALNAGDIASFVAKSGKVLRADGYEVFDPKTVRKPLGVAHSYKGGVVFSGEGDLESFGSFDNKELGMPPADLLKGLRIVAGGAIDGSLVFLTQDGKVVGWNGRTKKLLEFGRLNNSAVLEMAVGDGFGFRTSEGKILMCDHNGLFGNGGFAALGTEALKGQSGPFVRVQGTIRFGAVQHEDGSWLGWGEAATLSDKVKSLGSVLDLDAAYQTEANSKQVQSMMLAWIELPSGAKPSAATKPASPTPAQPAGPAVRNTPLLLATKDNPFTNSLGMKFVPVPGTDILMCIHETRYKDYAAYAAEAQGVDGTWKDQSVDGFTPTENKEDHAIMKVSWDDAQAFCAWLSKKEGKTYRLPTDREWSLAVGLGRAEKWTKNSTPESLSTNSGEFPWDGPWPPRKGSGNYADAAFLKNNPDNVIPPSASLLKENYNDGYATTAPIMKFEPNKLKIYDMGGNVSEWCLEWYDAGQTQRLTRGGSWEDHQPQTLASGRRIPLPLSYRTNSVGFRIVLDTRAPASPSGAATKPATPTPPQQAAPAPKPATAAKSDFTNSLGMQFVKISGIKTLFCIHETRYKDYAAYAAATPDVNPRWKNQTLKGIAPKDRTEDHPVVIVSWEDAQAFCAWLSQKEGKRYRLPTDEEWSYAAGIGRDEKRKKGDTPGTLALVPNEYPWGSQWPPSKGCENYGDESYKAAIGEARYLTGYDDGFPTTAPVMSFKPNRYGLYDMGGNVLEWCEDWYNTTQTSRALRGSSWKGGAYDSELRLSHRGQATPDTREDNYGFRIVLETTE